MIAEPDSPIEDAARRLNTLHHFLDMPRRRREARIAAEGLLDVEVIARVQAAHDRRIWSSGEVECACGEWQVTRDAEGYKSTTREFRSDAVRAHMGHVSAAIRAAILGEHA